MLCFTTVVIAPHEELIELYGTTLSCFVAATDHELHPKLSPIHEPLLGPYVAEWRKAMDVELQSLVDRGT